MSMAWRQGDLSVCLGVRAAGNGSVSRGGAGGLDRRCGDVEYCRAAATTLAFGSCSNRYESQGVKDASEATVPTAPRRSPPRLRVKQPLFTPGVYAVKSVNVAGKLFHPCLDDGQLAG